MNKKETVLHILAELSEMGEESDLEEYYERIMENMPCKPHDYEIEPAIKGTCKHCGYTWYYER